LIAFQRIRNLETRWWIVVFLFFAALINYVDRQSLSVAAPVLRDEFGLTNTRYGQIVSSFMLAYALMHPVAGRIIDLLGTRKGFPLAVIWWSVANMLHAFAQGALSLGGFRFLLGMGEAGLLPGSVKTVAEWFPKAERAFAVGITNVGIGLGAVLAPPLVTWLILAYSWRTAFVVTGALGLIWVSLWLALYPSRVPSLDGSGRLTAEPDQGESSTGESRFSWRYLLSFKEVWGLMAARFLADPVWYFYLFWLPAYLSESRGFTLSEIGAFAWIPFVAAMAGNLLGGMVPGVLMKKGWSLDAARKSMIVVSAFLVPSAIGAAFVENVAVSMALISLAVFLIWIWATNLFTLPADLFPSRWVGSVFGLSGAAGSLGGMIFMPLVGWIVDHFSYGPVFLVVGLLHPLAACILLATISRVDELALAE
jgi:ACS family hexuronate transporter-like MFS transporter